MLRESSNSNVWMIIFRLIPSLFLEVRWLMSGSTSSTRIWWSVKSPKVIRVALRLINQELLYVIHQETIFSVHPKQLYVIYDPLPEGSEITWIAYPLQDSQTWSSVLQPRYRLSTLHPMFSSHRKAAELFSLRVLPRSFGTFDIASDQYMRKLRIIDIKYSPMFR